MLLDECPLRVNYNEFWKRNCKWGSQEDFNFFFMLCVLEYLNSEDVYMYYFHNLKK